MGNFDANKYISSIWISEDVHADSDKNISLVSYPGITPELLIPLEGCIKFFCKGKMVVTSKSVLFAFLNANLYVNFSSLQKFALISFKSRGLAGLLPFMSVLPTDLIKNPIIHADLIFGEKINHLQKGLREKETAQITYEILDFLKSCFTNETGFIAEVAEGIDTDFTLSNIRKCTNYSYSTIERKFKAETGLTPKRYLTLKRFKTVVATLIESGNTDWMNYVAAYDYHDQSHFIKEIKKYTGLTPSQLLEQKNFLKYRPDIRFLTNFYNEKP